MSSNVSHLKRTSLSQYLVILQLTATRSIFISLSLILGNREPRHLREMPFNDHVCFGSMYRWHLWHNYVYRVQNRRMQVQNIFHFHNTRHTKYVSRYFVGDIDDSKLHIENTDFQDFRFELQIFVLVLNSYAFES